MRRLALCSCTVLMLLGIGSFTARAQFLESQQLSDPRALRAIHELQNLIAYLEANPYYYGGHKEAAIAKARATIDHLRAAMGPRRYFWSPPDCCYARPPLYYR
ncbi:MAG: hypothetical protein ACLPKB_02340 [Xanthobacteraceae bacterium]